MAKKKRYYGMDEAKMERGYGSIAGDASRGTAMPDRSFQAEWPVKPQNPGMRYPDGINDIDGICEKQYKMMKKQASDKLY